MQEQRYIFIDYLRGFVFMLMAFDHALHAYAQNWGQFWFIKDYSRSLLWDAFYLFDQSIIMPMLFFISGLWVLPSLKRYGGLVYVKRKFIKLGIPFIVCIPLIVPLLTYPKYILTVNPHITYLDYWFNVFLSGERLQAGPLWVMYAMFLFSLILLGINSIPKVVAKWATLVQSLINKPLHGFIALIILSALVLGICDLIWGAPWWIGWGVFYLQGSRFLLYFIYFMIGAGISSAGLLEDRFLWKKISDRLSLWISIMALFAIMYVAYSLIFIHDGAYSNDIRVSFREVLFQGQSWSEIYDFLKNQGWNIISSYAPKILIRTTLHAILCLFQVLTLLALFYRYCNKFHSTWDSLARSCYGIFLLHEGIVIWLQYGLIGVEIPLILKIAISMGIGFGGAWLITNKWLLRIPLFKHIIG